MERDTGASSPQAWTAQAAQAQQPLPYCATPIDRVNRLRADEQAVRAALADEAAEVLPFLGGRWLRDAQADRTTIASLVDPDEFVLLGFAGDRPVVTVDLSHLSEPEAVAATGATDAVNLRAIVTSLSPSRAALLAYARGMVLWAAGARFCGYCGERTLPSGGGTSRRCRGCARQSFPRIEPAVIVVVETGPPPRCLLARHHDAAPDGYATLAGFVEVGESLEDAVRREVKEETGIPVGNVRYRGSQAWPFPAGLMVGFRATALAEDVRVDGEELREARWFTVDEAAAIAKRTRADSIERYLLIDWARDHGGR